MATLTGKTIANTYKDLLQVSNNNNGLTGTVQSISDGAGTNSALQLSNAAVNINGTFQLNGESLTVNASAINNMADIGSATGIIAVNSGSVYGRTLTAGAPVSITNANGTAGNPTITLASIANVSGSYGPFTNFGVNDYGQIVSATAVSTSVSVPTIRATELIAQTLTLSSNASIVGNVNVDGTFIVDGIVSAASDVAVSGSLYVTSNISVTGNTKTNFLQAVSASIGKLNVGTLAYELVSVSALTANNLTVVSAATFNSDVTFTGASYNAFWDKSDNALEFADSARLIFGTGSDLTIYHDGSNSYITESGDETGSLNIKGTNLFLLDADNEYKVGAVSGGAVTLYHDNSAAKLATTATGINVTGNVSATAYYGDGSNLTGLPGAVVSVPTYTINQLTIVSAATLAGTDLGTKITALETSIGTTNTLIATTSAALATSIGNSNTNITTNINAITSINTVLAATSAALATSIGNSNTNITTNINAITSINSILGNGSGFATDAELQAVSATMATSIANHLPLAGGTLTGALQANSTITVGVDDTGYDVKFFGDTASAYMLWDASADDLILGGASKLGVGAAPNATFGSFIYAQGTPTANKPIIGAYSQGNSNTAGLGLFNDSGNRGIWTTGSVLRFTQTYEGNSTDHLVIDASGLVGIGTASPSEELHIFAAAPTIKLEDSDNNLSGYINGDNGNVLLQSHNVNRDIIFGENAASGEIMRVMGLGRVGIGTSAPDSNHKLEVYGTGTTEVAIRSGNSSEAIINFGDVDSRLRGRITYNNTNEYLAFWANAGEKVRIDSGGNVGIGTTAPDSDAKLDVNGQVLVRSTGAGVDTTPGGQYGFYIQPDSGGNVNLMSYSGGGSTQLRFYTNDSGAAAAERMSISSTGAVTVQGAFSKGSGSFKIDHPLPAKKDTHHLVHSFVEGPQADLIYRGRATLVDGQASVNIDDAAGMTNGTFEVLCRDIQCFTSNETGWTAVKGSVSGVTLTIEAQDNTCTDTISWMVVGERKDQHMYDTNWTDDDGKVIVEPLKQDDE